MDRREAADFAAPAFGQISSNFAGGVCDER